MTRSTSTVWGGRRRFLRLCGAAAVCAQASRAFGALPDEVESRLDGKLYRGTADGRILVSGDAGRTWEEVARFGPAIRVEEIRTIGQGRVRARLRDSRHVFWVQSNNDRIWLTDDYVPPSVA